MKRNIRIEKRLVRDTFKNLEGIHSAAKTIMKSWKIQVLPLKVFKEIIGKAKMSTTTEFKAVNNYNEKYNKVLDSLYTHLATQANKLGAKGFPIIELRRNLDVIKRTFASAVTKE